MANIDKTPFFCVETEDKISKKKLFINISLSKAVIYPKVDYDGPRLLKEVSERGPVIEEFKIPLLSSPIFWSKEEQAHERQYVIEIAINDLFGIRRIAKDEMGFMRPYLIEVAMLAVEEKFNSPNSGQFLGHKLDLNFRQYKVLESKQAVERTNEIVHNKVTIIEESTTSNSRGYDEKIVDLYYRPGSKILTCNVLTDRLPDSIGFNDDRIVMKLGDTTLVDTYLPFNIDLKEPMKYRFLEKFGAIRVVFKIL